MKRALVITSAGCSTRFSRSVGRDVLKVLYSEAGPEQCLLGEQLAIVGETKFDRIVIVGGYAFEELRDYVTRHYGHNRQIETIYNSKFRDYGTCYSFACGLEALRNDKIDEIVFMEGDLMFDRPTFLAIINCGSDVVTANRNVIRANNAVVFYTATNGRLRYVYDTQHKSLLIDEPFTLLGNSGQVWKFRDVPLLHYTVTSLGESLFDDTNLIPVEKYFTAKGIEGVEFITFNAWFNCNTIDDYHAIRRYKECHAYHQL